MKLRTIDIKRNQRKTNGFVSAKDTMNCVYNYMIAQNVINENIHEVIQVKPWRQTIKI